MNKVKKIVVLTAIVAMLFAIAGCGKKKTEEVKIDKNTIYKEERINLNISESFQMNQLKVLGDKIYFTGYEYDDNYGTNQQQWGYCSFDGTNVKLFNLPVESGWIDNFYPMENGNVFLTYSEYFEDYSDPDNYFWKNYYYVALCDGKTGDIIQKEDLVEKYGIDWISSVNLFPNNTLVLDGGNGTRLIFDETLKLVNKKENANPDNYYYTYFTLKSGKVVVSFWGDYGEVFAYFDPATMTRGEEISFKFNISNYSIVGSNKDYDILLSNQTGIFGYNLGDEAPVELFNFINSDLTMNYFDSFVSLDDGSFIGSYYEWTSQDDYGNRVCRYTKVDPSTIVDKKILTLGCTYINQDMRNSVIKYNKESDEYRIVIKDYSEYDTEENWNGSTEKLNSDIASGKCPDILFANDSSMIDNFAGKGLFVDLNKYLDNDPDIDRNDIWPSLIEACSKDGKLYELAASFYVSTLIGKESLVGDKVGWNLDEFIAFNNSLPEGMELFQNVNRESMMYTLLSANASTFVDRTKAECYFDSQEFITLLEFLKTLPVLEDDYYLEINWDEYDTAFRKNKAALSDYTLYDLSDFGYQEQGTFGEKVAFVGYPSNDGKGSRISIYGSYAISSKCKNQEGAWDFIKQLWTPEYQKSIWGVPATITRFNEMAEEAKKVPTYEDWEGNIVESPNMYYIGGQEIEIKPLTDADIERVRNLILSANQKAGDLADIEEILSEELESFFAGQKSAEDVAKIIQSRVSIYLNEKQ